MYKNEEISTKNGGIIRIRSFGCSRKFRIQRDRGLVLLQPREL